MSLRGKLVSAVIMGVAVTATGCGSGSSSGVGGLLSGAQLSTYQQNGDTYAEFEVQLSTESFLISDIDLPILDPNDPSVTYGSISLNNALCMTGSTCTSGGGELIVSVNLTQIANLNTTSDLLPNGTAIPISGLTASDVFALPIGGSGGTVYLDLTSGQQMIGVALPFQELNGVGAYVPGADIFSPVSLGNVTGVVGIFAGAASGQTGIGVFADLASVLSSSNSVGVASSSAVEAKAEVSSKLKMKSVTPSFSQEVKLYNSLSELNSRGTRLHLQ